MIYINGYVNPKLTLSKQRRKELNLYITELNIYIKPKKLLVFNDIQGKELHSADFQNLIFKKKAIGLGSDANTKVHF